MQATPALEDHRLAVRAQRRTLNVVTGVLRELTSVTAGRAVGLDRHGVEIGHALLFGDEPDLLAVLGEEGIALVAFALDDACGQAAGGRHRVDVVVRRTAVVVLIDRVEAANIDDGLAVGGVRAIATTVAREATNGPTRDSHLVEVDTEPRGVAVGSEQDALPVRRPVAHDLEAAVERDALGFAARHGHDVDVVAAVARRRERDARTVGTHPRQRVLRLVNREASSGALAVRVGDPDITAVREDDLLAIRRERGVAQAARVLLGGVCRTCE